MRSLWRVAYSWRTASDQVFFGDERMNVVAETFEGACDAVRIHEADRVIPGGPDEDIADETITEVRIDGGERINDVDIVVPEVFDEAIEKCAAAVHDAYLETCARLDWPVSPKNQVPYDELSEDSKELDRASVRATLRTVARA